MQSYVFDPLGMRNTTMDFALAQRRKFATAHAPDVGGSRGFTRSSGQLLCRSNPSSWRRLSSVDDMLKYVAMELAEGRDRRNAVHRSQCASRAPGFAGGRIDGRHLRDGSSVDRVYGTPVVHHGGDMIGFHSDMIWLPEYGVGAVVVTNADPGWQIRTIFQRKLLEVLFDGRPEAGAQIEAQSKTFYEEMAAERRLLTIPAETKPMKCLPRAMSIRRWVRLPSDTRVRQSCSTLACSRVKWDRESTPMARHHSLRQYRA